MATRTPQHEPVETLEELMEQLGNIPLSRVRMQPPPGTATEEHLAAAGKHAGRKLVELVEGVLVEKAVGTREALLGGIVVHLMWNYLEVHKLGKALPGDAWLRLMPGLVRVPDVAFVSWARMPGGRFPRQRVAALVPDLAVEILSEGNTRQEINRKLRDYFLASTTIAWVIDPRKETARVYHAPDESRRVGKTGSLDGEDVLPGFKLSLGDLFARADEEEPAA
jgi:Uma2 family endonuclease